MPCQRTNAEAVPAVTFAAPTRPTFRARATLLRNSPILKLTVSAYGVPDLTGDAVNIDACGRALPGQYLHPAAQWGAVTNDPATIPAAATVWSGTAARATESISCPKIAPLGGVSGQPAPRWRRCGMRIETDTVPPAGASCSIQ